MTHPDSRACLRHLDVEERRNGIPKGLLLAIALVESERGGVPWPWTLNVSGKDLRFASREQALRAMHAGGRLRKTMAVGCMQIFTDYHAHKFPSGAAMIDPATNVAYGARYLAELRRKHGSWVSATAYYHSSTGRYQLEYLCRVVTKRVANGYQVPNDWYRRSCGRRPEAERTNRAAGGFDFSPEPIEAEKPENRGNNEKEAGAEKERAAEDRPDAGTPTQEKRAEPFVPPADDEGKTSFLVPRESFDEWRTGNAPAWTGTLESAGSDQLAASPEIKRSNSAQGRSRASISADGTIRMNGAARSSAGSLSVGGRSR